MKSRHERLNVNHIIGNFFRKGQVGDWKNAASEGLNNKMDEWIQENCRGIDISYKYE